ncbi:MAG: thiamine phosphate synthase [Pseudomonadota bacterium]
MWSYGRMYGKALRAASPALCGRKGGKLVRPGRHVSAFVFLGPEHIKSADIAALHPNIGVVVRDYDDACAADVAHLLALCKRQRRAVFYAGPAGTAPSGVGLHVPRWRRITRAKRTSCSVHSMAEAIRARRAGAHVVFVSPVFPTASHPGASPAGLFSARRWAQAAKAACFGLGGITMSNARQVMAGGLFDGVAGISVFLEG